MAGIDAFLAPPNDFGRHLFTVGPNANANTWLLARPERVIKERVCLGGCACACVRVSVCPCMRVCMYVCMYVSQTI